MARILSNKFVINAKILLVVLAMGACIRADCPDLPDLNSECNSKLAKVLAGSYAKIDKSDNASCVYSALPNKKESLKYIIEHAYGGVLQQVNATLNFIDTLSKEDQLTAAGILQDAMIRRKHVDNSEVFKMAAKFKLLMKSSVLSDDKKNEATTRYKAYSSLVRSILESDDGDDDTGVCITAVYLDGEKMTLGQDEAKFEKQNKKISYVVANLPPKPNDKNAIFTFQHRYDSNVFAIKNNNMKAYLWSPGNSWILNPMERFAFLEGPPTRSSPPRVHYDWVLKTVANQTAVVIQNKIWHEYLSPSISPPPMGQQFRYFTTWRNAAVKASGDTLFYFKIDKCEI